jgi:hypothetical protein
MLHFTVGFFLIAGWIFRKPFKSLGILQKVFRRGGFFLLGTNLAKPLLSLNLTRGTRYDFEPPDHTHWKIFMGK